MKSFYHYGPLSPFIRNFLPICLLSFPSILLAAPVQLSETDKDVSISLSADQLGVIYSAGNNHRGVRSNTAIQPGSRFFY